MSCPCLKKYVFHEGPECGCEHAIFFEAPRLQAEYGLYGVLCVQCRHDPLFMKSASPRQMHSHTLDARLPATSVLPSNTPESLIMEQGLPARSV